MRLYRPPHATLPVHSAAIRTSSELSFRWSNSLQWTCHCSEPVIAVNLSLQWSNSHLRAATRLLPFCRYSFGGFFYCVNTLRKQSFGIWFVLKKKRRQYTGSEPVPNLFRTCWMYNCSTTFAHLYYYFLYQIILYCRHLFFI